MDESSRNFTGKYTSQNPISEKLVASFFSSLKGLVQEIHPASVFEIGCGEGYVARSLAEMGIKVRGVDVREEAISEARRMAEESGLRDLLDFSVLDIYREPLDATPADLIVCCEVFEHLADPQRALQLIAECDVPHLIASVPREPVWRILNMCRLKYLKDMGNTPGHVNHWSRSEFLEFLKQRYNIVSVETPLPWTMALCRQKR